MAFVFFLHRVESGDQTQVAQLVGSKFISLAQSVLGQRWLLIASLGDKHLK